MKEKKTLKMFIWKQVLCDYGCGMVAVLAHDVEEARKLAHEKDEYIPEKELDGEPKIITKPEAFTVWGGS